MNRRKAMKIMLAATGSMAIPCVSNADAEDVSNVADNSAPVEFETKTGGYANKPVFTWLRLGDVVPEGWIKQQMLRDLQTGFAGCLDKLCPQAASDIFATGRIAQGTSWWNGETQGNWRAGFIMLSYLSGDAVSMRKTDAWVSHVLAFQEKDGYLGIFQKGSRFKCSGELWTQACLLRGLLDYAELTRSPSVLAAIRRAVDLSIAAYHGGDGVLPCTNSHDLMISDVLERLFELTGDVKYPRFTQWLYKNWDWAKTGSGTDDSLANLLDLTKPFTGHGVHTVENIRVPLWLAAVTGREAMCKASQNAFIKLGWYALPGGSTVSSEFISNQAPDPSKAEFEYCTTKETLVTYLSALHKSGNAEHAERVERVFFNDAQASRLADGKGITYLTSDNRYACDGRTPDGKRAEPRNRFSPTHQNVAVCCNPNSTNVAPYYVRSMWTRHQDGGLAALLYGPCRVATTVGGLGVELEESTHYPFGHTVEVVVRPERETHFSLYFRDPHWSHGTELKCPGARIRRKGDFWKVSKRWKPGDRVLLEFKAQVREVAAVNGELALRYGPLLYALPISSRKQIIRTFPLPGFVVAYYNPELKMPVGSNIPANQDIIHDDLAIVSESRWNGFGFTVQQNVRNPSTMLYPFDKPPLRLHGTLINKATGDKCTVDLIPLGCASILRRLTFPVQKS